MSETPVSSEVNNEQPFHREYAEYKKLGGEGSYKSFEEMAKQFVAYTYDIFVGGEATTIKRKNGEPLFVESREMAMGYFIKDCCNSNPNEGYRVYYAIDQVVSWT